LLTQWSTNDEVIAAVSGDGAAFAWDLSNLARVQDHVDKGAVFESWIIAAACMPCLFIDLIVLLSELCSAVNLSFFCSVASLLSCSLPVMFSHLVSR
jgi:hypothetical protein